MKNKLIVQYDKWSARAEGPIGIFAFIVGLTLLAVLIAFMHFY